MALNTLNLFLGLETLWTAKFTVDEILKPKSVLWIKVGT